MLKNKFERLPWTRRHDKVFVKPAWTLEKSIFQRRKAESDAKDFYDTEKLLNAQVRFCLSGNILLSCVVFILLRVAAKDVF